MIRFKKGIILLSVFTVACLTSFNLLAAGQTQKISGNIVDVVNSEIYPGTLVIEGEKIQDIIKEDKRGRRD